MPKPKILIVDIETFPNIGFTWGRYEQNVIEFLQQRCIATYAAKWLNGPVFAKSLPDYSGYKPGSYDDKAITGDLWKLFDEADIIVAHNGDQFDIPIIRGRFLQHGYGPTTPFKTVDTKKVSKRNFGFNSNALNDIGQQLELGKKIKTDFSLWRGCIDGDMKSWATMVKYNKQDVLLLEKVYKRFLPWMVEHPNYGLYDTNAVCPKCGSADIQWRGYAQCITRVYKRFVCKSCGGWGRAGKSEKDQAAGNVNCA